MKYIFQDEDSISIYKGTPEEINELIRLLAAEDKCCTNGTIVETTTRADQGDGKRVYLCSCGKETIEWGE